MTRRKQRTHGTSGGIPLTDDLIEALADEAEAGYDVSRFTGTRKRGRPPIGEQAATVFQVRLDPALREALVTQAEAQHTTPSELARRLLRKGLGA